jgi:hypothetical protein
MKKVIISVFVLTLSFFVSAQTDIDSEKKKLIDALLEQTGQSAIAMSKQFSDAFIQQMTNVLIQSQSNVEPKAFDILREEITAIIDEELITKSSFNEMLYPIYSKNFSVEELEKMIELNKTELGQKLIRVMPVLTQESIQAGQLLGQSLAPIIQQRIAERFEKEGIK